MRSFPVALACVAAALGTHRPAAAGAQTVRALVRGADAAAPVVMAVELRGRLFASLGVAPGPDGRRVGGVRLTGPGGTATTPAALEVGERPGAVTFRAPAGGPELELTVPGTALRARGRAVRLVRARAGGPLRAEPAPAAP
jgi:hypothetical protein